MNAPNQNKGASGIIIGERKNNMSFNCFCLNKDFVVIGSDSRETYVDGKYRDEYPKTFINKNHSLCWSVTGLLKYRNMDCVRIINSILNNDSTVIDKLSLIEIIMKYETLNFYNEFHTDVYFDLFLAESINNKINVYLLEVKNGESSEQQKCIFRQNEKMDTIISSGVHTEVKDNFSNGIHHIDKTVLEMNRIIHLAIDTSSKDDNTVGGRSYIALMTNDGDIKTYINGIKKEF